MVNHGHIVVVIFWPYSKTLDQRLYCRLQGGNRVN